MVCYPLAMVPALVPLVVLLALWRRAVRRAEAAERTAEEWRGTADKWRRAAEEDPLTGCLTKRGWENHAPALLDAGGRWWWVEMDLDQFKPLNDLYGHAVGNKVLAAVGQRLSEAAGAGLVARQGGDEFSLLVPADPDRTAAQWADELRRRVSEPIDIGGLRRVSVTASVGVTLANGSVEQASTVADRLMYQDKRRGKQNNARPARRAC